MRFDEKVVVVSGAAGTGAGATGRIIVRKFLEEGAKVVLVDLNEESGKAYEAELTEKGYDVLFVKCDISNEEDVKNVFAKTIEKYGKVDILINGAFYRGQDGPLVAEEPVDVWRKTMDVNVNGCFYMTRYALPELCKQEKTAIVNITSTASIRSEDTCSAYGASKSAVNAFTKYVATQYGRFGVRCNAVLPGLILSPEMDAYLSQDEMLKGYFHTLKRQVVTQRTHSTGEDIANAVLFFADPVNDMITGQELIVDGGLTIHNPCWADLAGK